MMIHAILSKIGFYQVNRMKHIRMQVKKVYIRISFVCLFFFSLFSFVASGNHLTSFSFCSSFLCNLSKQVNFKIWIYLFVSFFFLCITEDNHQVYRKRDRDGNMRLEFSEIVLLMKENRLRSFLGDYVKESSLESMQSVQEKIDLNFLYSDEMVQVKICLYIDSIVR